VKRRRRRPLGAISLVFAGFVTLVLLTQLSAYEFALDVPRGYVGRATELVGVRDVALSLALSAAAFGLIFACVVLIITRKMVMSEVDIYRVTGLAPSSALGKVLQAHSARPVAWVLGAAVLTSLIDLDLGLNAFLPLGLATSFVALLLAWLVLLTYRTFSLGDAGDVARRGRTG
jgi:hypothetical protein